MIHELPLERRTLHGHFSRDLPPIATDRPRRLDRLRLSERRLATSRRTRRSSRATKSSTRGTRSIGPVEVRGARRGRPLVVQIDEVRPGHVRRDHGLDTRVEWTIDAEAVPATDDRGPRVQLAPFLGVIGMPPDEDGVHSTGPPRRWGGNIDCKELVAGDDALPADQRRRRARLGG